MSNNDKDNKHTRHISRKIYLVMKGEKCKMHNNYWFEGGLQWAEIATKNFGEHDLPPRMKYILW